MASEQRQRIVVTTPKNVGLAALLTFLLGPFGMFYSTTVGALVMMILYPLIGIVTVGFGLLVLHPIAIAWAAASANARNKRIMAT